MSYRIAIANEKGGVAKTTSTVSLAGALVEKGKHVLAVDLDPSIGYEGAHTIYIMLLRVRVHT